MLVLRAGAVGKERQERRTASPLLVDLNVIALDDDDDDDEAFVAANLLLL